MRKRFKYKPEDLKVLSRQRRSIHFHSPITALICSSPQDRKDLFAAADHERFAWDALMNYTGAIKTLTKTRMEQHVTTGGHFKNDLLTDQALKFVQCVKYRRAYLTDRSSVTRRLAVRYMPVTDLQTMTSDKSVPVLREVFRWGDQGIQDTLYPVLMALKTQTTYRAIAKYALNVKHRANARLRCN